jgi:protein-glutamine gamma-glutamyltransferase
VTVLAAPPSAPPEAEAPAAPRPPRRDDTAGGGRLPLLAARGSMLLALVIIGGLRWMSLLEPAAPHRAWEAVGAAVLGGAGLALAGRLRGGLRPLVAGVVGVAMMALCLLAGGLADEHLRPDHWSELFGGIGRGLEALPGINVPYQGTDEWTRVVLGAGGTALIGAATALALWPRRTRVGFPLAALVLLVALAVVPAVVLAFDGEFLLGALLSVLVLGFLRLEKLRRRDAPAAAALGAGAAVAALVLAPAFDGRTPWFDYENWALSASTTRTTQFSWDHDYSPLLWPRDGRELLRVRASRPAYWKAMNLDLFVNGRWIAGREPDPDRAAREIDPFSAGRWEQQIRVTVRNLRTPSIVTAGTTEDVSGLPDGVEAFPAGGGVMGATRALTRGDSYRATVYTPRPTDAQLQTVATDYAGWTADYLGVFIDADSRSSAPGARPDHIVRFPVWDSSAGLLVQAFFSRPGQPDEDPGALLESAGLGRIYRLALRLREGTETPFEYVENVERYLAAGFAYSEVPPQAAQTLDGFLFDAKVGFCQQYSGAMALLLRMGGIPARVATGFTTGSLDQDENEYVVRDLDAHSWVEAWFPGYGWVTRDPTPAAAPPRSQPGDATGGGTVNGPASPDLGGEQREPSPSAPVSTDEGELPVGTLLLGAGLVLAVVAAIPLERRRRRRLPPPAQRPMAEFERALRRARYDAGPGATLARLERAFAGLPEAAGYVRALREQRYSGRVAAPTRRQRRSLRTALARSTGHLRAWWALPPRAPVPRRDGEHEDEEIVRRLRV